MTRKSSGVYTKNTTLSLEEEGAHSQFLRKGLRISSLLGRFVRLNPGWSLSLGPFAESGARLPLTRSAFSDRGRDSEPTAAGLGYHPGHHDACAAARPRAHAEGMRKTARRSRIAARSCY